MTGSSVDLRKQPPQSNAGQRVLALRTAPLSSGQERLFRDEYFPVAQDPRWRPEALRPIDTCAVLLDGPLEAEALRVAVVALVQRQTALRTTFRFPRGRAPVQVLMEASQAPLRLQAGDPADEHDLQSLVGASTGCRVRPYDHDLFRARLISLGEGRHLLLVDIHHLVSDGWSISVLYRELSELYNAAAAGRAPWLPTLPRTYGEICAQMAMDRLGPTHKRQLQYWERVLGKPPKRVRFLGREVPSYEGLAPVHDASVHVAAREVAALRALSAASAIPGGLSGPVLTALAIIIHMQTRTKDVRIGSMIAGRTMADAAHMIGNFVNTVIICLPLDGDTQVDALLGAANSRIAGAMDNQDVPIQDVLAQVSPTEDALYHVTLALNTMRRGPLALDGLECRDLHSSEEGNLKGARRAPTKIVQRWLLDESESGLHGSITCNSDVIDITTMADTVAAFGALLQSLPTFDGSVSELWSEHAAPAVRRPQPARERSA